MSEMQKDNTNRDIELKSEEMSGEAPNQKEQKTQKPTLPPHKEYAKRLLKYKRYYLQLLTLTGVLAAVGVAVAIIYNLLLGVLLAVLAAFLYAFLASDEMYKTIGLKYKSVVGGIKLTACRAKYGEVFWIPSSLIFFDVTELGDAAFASPKNDELIRIFLPKTLKKIGVDAFCACDSLKEIFFEGTRDEWEAVESLTDLSSYKIIFEAKYPPVPKKKKKSKNTKQTKKKK